MYLCSTCLSVGVLEAQIDSVSAASTPGEPLNVIFMIGDGMGLTQLSAGMYANRNSIAFERMPVVGLHKSHSSDNLTTDSAAGATAFACGKKSYNGAIGVTPDTVACETILEHAHDRQMPTGVVATSTIVHATPACYFAHTAARSSYEIIAAQLAASPVDFFVGGGQRFFTQRESDDTDLVAQMRTAGRIVDSYFDKSIGDIEPDPTKTYGYLTALEDPLPVSGGRDYLVPATRDALAYLSARDTTDRGFFLMVEGSQIDWGGHANDSKYIISETIDFSHAVDVALDFALEDGNTLVVVTADHETGGYAIDNGSTRDNIVGGFTSDYHTATMIPVFAFGPSAETFAGIYENTAIYDKLMAAIRSAGAGE